MKINWSKLFSFSASESEYFNESRDKIELADCNLAEMSCMNYLPQINNYFRDSHSFYRDRDFNRSIEALEKAYNKAGEISDPACLKCALFFQTIVIQSLESIHSELESMSKGFFSTRRYHVCFIKADDLMKKIKPAKENIFIYSSIKESSMFEPAYL